jgi:hypothetical protein
MFFFWDRDDGEGLVLALSIGLLTGTLCGALPLTIGLIRGHRSMAWTGFGFCVLLGAGCFVVAMIPSIVFTLIVALSQPIERQRRKKRPPRRRRAPERPSRDYEVLDNDEDGR